MTQVTVTCLLLLNILVSCNNKQLSHTKIPEQVLTQLHGTTRTFSGHFECFVDSSNNSSRHVDTSYSIENIKLSFTRINGSYLRMQVVGEDSSIGIHDCKLYSEKGGYINMSSNTRTNSKNRTRISYDIKDDKMSEVFIVKYIPFGNGVIESQHISLWQK